MRWSHVRMDDLRVAALTTPLIVGHRGACGYRPEHTLDSYELAARLGADSLEPDLVLTRDGVLICRHEPELSRTTDVACRPEFAGRRRTRWIGGRLATGWFAEDFTLAEVQTLVATERMRQLRPANARCAPAGVATFAELLQLRTRVSAQLGREVGLSVELKDPSRYRDLGLDMERAVVDELAGAGLLDGAAPVYLQSFELRSLVRLRTDLGLVLPLIFLVEDEGVPGGLGPGADHGTYADLLAPRGLRLLASWVDGIGPSRRRVVPVRADGTLAAPTALVADAHAAGLRVHVWTFRAENHHLPAALRRGQLPGDHGDALAELTCFLRAGVDALICDQPDLGVRARANYLATTAALPTVAQ